jgi:hypothetical protein
LLLDYLVNMSSNEYCYVLCQISHVVFVGEMPGLEAVVEPQVLVEELLAVRLELGDEKVVGQAQHLGDVHLVDQHDARVHVVDEAVEHLRVLAGHRQPLLHHAVHLQDRVKVRRTRGQHASVRPVEIGDTSKTQFQYVLNEICQRQTLLSLRFLIRLILLVYN